MLQDFFVLKGIGSFLPVKNKSLLSIVYSV